MFAIHEMDDDMGHPVEEPLEGEVEDENLTAGRDRILLPPVVSLTVEGLTSNGVYLLDNGVEMFLWVGRTADMNVVSSLFGTHSLEDMDPNQVSCIWIAREII
jgi:protein transport protein SEC24